MSSQSEPTFDELSRELDKRVGGTDKLRADELAQLAETRRAKQAAMESEEARLARKYPPGHTRRVAISNRIAANRNLTRDLNLEVSRVRADIPRVGATGWAVHGHVRDKDLKPVGGLTVALYDSQARWVEAMGYACTRADGYYRIETKQVGATDGPFFLHVLSGNATHLYADSTPLRPVGGAVDSREVVLGSAVCAPPVTNPNDPVPGPGAGHVGGPGVKSGGWTVRGRVTNEEGQGLGGLVVSLYDRDLFFDDRLGQTETDANGYYSFNYRTEDFRDLIERKPDIYLKVLDRQGRTLYTSKRKVRYEAGRVEIINALVQ